MSQEVPRSWEKLSEEQLRIYAREVAELYQKEGQLRQELEEKNRELEQRMRELTGLNNLLQKDLQEHLPLMEAARQMVVDLQRLASEIDGLVQRAKSRFFSDR